MDRSVGFRVLLSVLAVLSLVWGINASAHADINFEIQDASSGTNGFGGFQGPSDAYGAHAVWLIVAAVLAFAAVLTLGAGIALWTRPLIAAAGVSLVGLFWMTTHVGQYVFNDTLGFTDGHTYWGMQMGVGIAVALGSIALAIRTPVARTAAAVLAVAAFIFLLIAAIEWIDLSEGRGTTAASMFLLAFAFLAFAAWLALTLLDQPWTPLALTAASLIFAVAFIVSATAVFVDEEPQKQLGDSDGAYKVMLQTSIAGAVFEYLLAAAWLFLIMITVLPFLPQTSPQGDNMDFG